MEEHQENGIKMKQNSEGHFQVDIVVPDGMRQYITHDYCFNKDRHSTNFFLKIGAVGELKRIMGEKRSPDFVSQINDNEHVIVMF